MTRQPDNRIGWILWLIGALYGLDSVASNYAIAATTLGVALPGVVLGAWFANWSFSLMFALATGFLPFLFPTGRPPSARWARLMPVLVAVTILVPLGDLIHPGFIQIGPAQIPNPTGMPGPVDDVLAIIGDLAPLLLVPLVIASAVTRFRRGSPVERQQMKWLTTAAALTGACLLLATTLLPLFDPVFGPYALIPALVTLGLVPVAIGIAVLRYRLYEIDRLLSRTAAWLVLTAVLAALFVALVVGLEALLAGFTGGDTLAVAMSTLVAAALFQPLRRRIQRAVDRRFDRAHYDANRAIDGFAARLRNQVDLRALTTEVSLAAQETVRPARAGVWLRSGANRSPEAAP